MKQRSFSVPFSLLITPTLGKYFFGELTTCGARLFVAWKHQTETYEVTLLLVELGEGCPCQVRPALLWVTHQLRVLVGGASEPAHRACRSHHLFLRPSMQGRGAHGGLEVQLLPQLREHSPLTRVLSSMTPLSGVLH